MAEAQPEPELELPKREGLLRASLSEVDFTSADSSLSFTGGGPQSVSWRVVEDDEEGGSGLEDSDAAPVQEHGCGPGQWSRPDNTLPYPEHVCTLQYSLKVPEVVEEAEVTPVSPSSSTRDDRASVELQVLCLVYAVIHAIFLR